MKAKLALLFLLAITTMAASSQEPAMELTFTAIDSAAWVQLDSIKVMNLTQGDEEMLYWPDTTITAMANPGDTLLYIGYSGIVPVGISEKQVVCKDFRISQNYPNPMSDQSTFSVFIPENGRLVLELFDASGRTLFTRSWILESGGHTFRVVPPSGQVFFLTARWEGEIRSIKMLSLKGQGQNIASIERIGQGLSQPPLKASQDMPEFVRESGIIDMSGSGGTFVFQFATNIPCPGTPTVAYEGQVYNTIQICSQCWMKENLNVGIMINNSQQQSDNGIIEKCCVGNSLDSCAKMGGLYQWDEMMQYTTGGGAQGICPPGWHVPINEEWKLLAGAVDSRYGIGNPMWNYINSWRGFDAGLNLKSTSGWLDGGNGVDLFGFTGLPDGWAYSGWNYSYWWASEEDNVNNAWDIGLRNDQWRVYRDASSKAYGMSVRCLRDY